MYIGWLLLVENSPTAAREVLLTSLNLLNRTPFLLHVHSMGWNCSVHISLTAYISLTTYFVHISLIANSSEHPSNTKLIYLFRGSNIIDHIITCHLSYSASN